MSKKEYKMEPFAKSLSAKVEFDGVTKYFLEKKALDNIDIKFYSGKITGYIGPNGAGKTTTLKILTGLIQDYSGKVLIDGEDVAKCPLSIKQKIGYVPENASIFESLTPVEYLSFVGNMYKIDPEIIEHRSIKMLSAFGILDNAHQYMHEFSKGMKQRIVLIAALLHNPSILILDEPFDGLDVVTIAIFKKVLIGLKKKNKTVIYSSHFIELVEAICDEVVMVNEGRIIDRLSIKSLRETGKASLEKMILDTCSKDVDLRSREILEMF